jgi:hypothetical protein
MSDKKWMQRYVFIDLHEIFFGEFPIILTQVARKVSREKWKVQGNNVKELDS